ncbi:unnamed protein product [Amoebophrya sp. A25]|nr:unnamed protein product [Amoebophrya sp. A25]|eukprot:GSA25T00019797001.1
MFFRFLFANYQMPMVSSSSSRCWHSALRHWMLLLSCYCFQLLPYFASLGAAKGARSRGSRSRTPSPHQIILDTEFDCDPIVSPEMPTRRQQGFAHLAEKFATEVETLRVKKQAGKWLYENINFVAADVDTVLEQQMCKSAVLTALVMKALLELLQGGLLQGQMPQDETPLLMLDAMLSNNLIQWVKNPASGIKANAPANVPEGMTHLLLSSSFPIYRLLHLLMMLFPETESTRMGHCRMHHDESIPLEKRVDWPMFKKQLENATKQVELPSLEPGITLTAAWNKRWDDLYLQEVMMTAADSGDVIFQNWRTDQYKAGCHLAVIGAYVLHSFWYARSDRQAWLQRFFTAVTSVHAVHAPIADSVKSDWPVYVLWDMLFRLRREQSDFPPRGDIELEYDYAESPAAALATGGAESQSSDRSGKVQILEEDGGSEAEEEPDASRRPSIVDREALDRLLATWQREKRRGAGAARSSVSSATATSTSSNSKDDHLQAQQDHVVFVTQAYGWMLNHMRPVVDRFRTEFGLNLVILAGPPETEGDPSGSEEDNNKASATSRDLLKEEEALASEADNGYGVSDESAASSVKSKISSKKRRSRRKVEEITGSDHTVVSPCTSAEEEEWCLPTFPSLLAKYDALTHFAEIRVPVCWVDLDIAWFQSPLKLFDEEQDFIFGSKDQYGIGVSPAMLCVPKVQGEESGMLLLQEERHDPTAASTVPSSEQHQDSDGLYVPDSLVQDGNKDYTSQSAQPLVLDILYQVRDTLLLNPFGHDLAMWDLIVGRVGADDVGGWDYQGRSHQANPDNRTLSYWDENILPLPVRGVKYKVIGADLLASGDGFPVSQPLTERNNRWQVVPRIEDHDEVNAKWIEDVRDYAAAASRPSVATRTKGFGKIPEVDVEKLIKTSRSSSSFPPPSLIGFHFYGAIERSEELFAVFYHEPERWDGERVLQQYVKFPKFDHMALPGGIVVEKRTRDALGNYQYLLTGGPGRDEEVGGAGSGGRTRGSPSPEIDDETQSEEEDELVVLDELQKSAAEKSERTAAKRARWARNRRQDGSREKEHLQQQQQLTSSSGNYVNALSSSSASAPSRSSSYIPTRWVHISYADGCCQKAIKKNLQSAEEYFDEQRAYDKTAFAPEWAERNAEILAVPRGGGLWIWKPYVVLKTLEDPSVPWDSALVYLDAGNHFTGDPRDFVQRVLTDTDVAVLQLKCCFEADWSKRETLIALHGDHHAIAERPQMGAYFLAFRKTPLTLRFVRDWLSKMSDPVVSRIETVSQHQIKNYAGFQKHMADQSALSVLFKQYGFKHMSLKDVHKFIALKRWRE